ncbi:unnamed protein product, partial [marine sediment metagenome]
LALYESNLNGGALSPTFMYYLLNTKAILIQNIS